MALGDFLADESMRLPFPSKCQLRPADVGTRYPICAAIRHGLLTVFVRHANVRPGLGSSSWADEMEDLPPIRMYSSITT
jgi:hypothetical protein